MICKHCKTINSDNAKFCRCCGSKLKSWHFHSLVISAILLLVCLATGLIISLVSKSIKSGMVVNDSTDKNVADTDNVLEGNEWKDSLTVEENGVYTIEYISFHLQSDSSLLAHIKINSSEESIGKKRLNVNVRFWQSNYQCGILGEDGMQLYIEKDISFGYSPTYATLRVSKKLIDIIKEKCYGSYAIFDVSIYDYDTKECFFLYIGKVYHTIEKYGVSDVLQKKRDH